MIKERHYYKARQVKAAPVREPNVMKPYEGVSVNPHAFLTSTLDGGLIALPLRSACQPD